MKHLRILRRLLFVLCALPLCLGMRAAETNPAALTALLDRIGGTGTAARFVTVVDNTLADGGKDVFILTSQGGKPCIKGNTPLSVATGINRYLNRYARVNLAWNNLTQDLTSVALPLPAAEERHTCSVDYRYYLNYCTFSYSMSTWTWERWQKEIDWMALHGINMPLQIVGLDVVWKNLLTKDLGYTSAEADKFIAGPCFQAWWGMNNLEGWGGPNPEWWYKRQEQLARQILQRQRELGMQPVLPGYSGMVPSDIGTKGYTANNQGNWCAFVRPYILDPNSPAFAEISAKYYSRLAEVMGTSDYYSMDPFHEGANTQGIDVASAYSKIGKAMTDANPAGKWVIQFWQWSGAQYKVLSQIQKGRLIVLDLFSDANTYFGDYQGHDAVYCALPNFGGRTGLFGRLTKIMTEFYKEKAKFPNLKGIGATPEAIEQVPVLYDALFELPWDEVAPDPAAWLADYTVARYGKDNAEARRAWEQVRLSALNCATGLQGPHEGVLCARPAMEVGSVSSWGGAGIFYDPQEVADAAFRLLSAGSDLAGTSNYSYDLVDFSRQALTDYGNYLLKAVNQADKAGDKAAYALRRDAYLNLILDLDELLNTNSNFMLGRWTKMARAIADEASGTTKADRDWLELDNARTLITTWGGRAQSENGGLRDYSYRMWGGMMKDFYYDRWRLFFDNRDKGTPRPDWFDHDWQWAHNASVQYSDTPVGETAEVAERLFGKYFLNFRRPDGTTYHVYRYLRTDARAEVADAAVRGERYAFPVAALPEGITARVGIDLNGDGTITADEEAEGLAINVPATAVTGKVVARLTLSDGTVFEYTLTQKDVIGAPRTVSVATADATQGTVAIDGTDLLSVTGTDEVTLRATPRPGYDFLHWTDESGNIVSTANPYTYYGAPAAAFTARFIVNKWGVPEEDRSEIGVVESTGQYLTELTVSMNGGSEQPVYSAVACPATLCQSANLFDAPKGGLFKLHWKDNGGMNYCRLSAYIDLNSDGDFDDEGELLKVEGNKSSGNNNMLHDYTLSVLLPYDMPEGITRVRLRFDGAWMVDNIDPKTDAMPAKAKTMRMVYDLPVNVTAHAATPCTVTVKTSDPKQGTVDANGQSETYTYAAGEDVILRCYPADGYAVNYWKDQYGRALPKAWMEGNKIRFKPAESGTFYAVFMKEMPGALTFGNWTFDYETNAAGITLTRVVSGSGDLVIPENVEGVKIVALAPGLLVGQEGLTSLTLPAALTDLGTALLASGNFKGAGVQGAALPIGRTVPAATAWGLNLQVKTNGSSFNAYGSALLATGTNPLADSYDRGFQLYLKKDGTLILKLGSSERKQFALTKDAKEFSVNLSADAEGKFAVVVTTAAATDRFDEAAYPLADITTLSTALPAGIDFTAYTLTDPSRPAAPFRGCKALAALKVAAGNARFSASSNLLLCEKGARLLAYPEGCTADRLTLPTTVKTVSAHAFTAAPALQRIVAKAAVPAVAEAEAFEVKGVYAQVPVTALAAYRMAWGLPLLCVVNEGETLDEAAAATLTAADAVEFRAVSAVCGVAPGLAANVPVWLTTSLPKAGIRAVFFPAAPTMITAEGSVGAVNFADCCCAWSLNGENFTACTPDKKGGYLLGALETMSEKELTFRFPGFSAAAMPLTSLTGNGTNDRLGLTGCYVYDSAANVFALRPDEAVTLAPFEGILAAFPGCPATIAGPDLTILGLTDLLRPASDPDRPTYDLQGRPLSPDCRTEGVVITRSGRKVINR